MPATSWFPRPRGRGTSSRVPIPCSCAGFGSAGPCGPPGLRVPAASWIPPPRGRGTTPCPFPPHARVSVSVARARVARQGAARARYVVDSPTARAGDKPPCYLSLPTPRSCVGFGSAGPCGPPGGCACPLRRGFPDHAGGRQAPALPVPPSVGAKGPRTVRCRGPAHLCTAADQDRKRLFKGLAIQQPSASPAPLPPGARHR